MLEERADAVENYQERTCDEAVAGLEPLAVRLVRVPWVVAVVHCGLGFGGVAVEFYVCETVAEEISGCSYEKGENSYVWKNFRYVAQMMMYTIRHETVQFDASSLSL